MQWVETVTLGKSAPKCVLLALANCHHDRNDECDPSVARIVQLTELNRKTVLKALEWLESEGLITTQKRIGAKNNYDLNWNLTSPKSGTASRRDTSSNFGTGSDGGTDPKSGTGQAETSPKSGTGGVYATSPKFSCNQSQIFLQPVPNLGHEQVTGNRKDIPPPYTPPEETDLLGDQTEPAKRSKPNRRIPDNFHVTQDMIRWVEENRYGHIELITETDKFIDHAKSKDRRQADWIAAWRNWIRNADKYQRQTQGNGDHRSDVARAIGGY